METQDQKQKNADRQYRLDTFGMFFGLFIQVSFYVGISYILFEGLIEISNAITQGLAG